MAQPCTDAQLTDIIDAFKTGVNEAKTHLIIASAGYPADALYFVYVGEKERVSDILFSLKKERRVYGVLDLSIDMRAQLRGNRLPMNF
jgi:hypothetical protein